MKHIKPFNENFLKSIFNTDNLFGSDNPLTKEIEEKAIEASNSLDNYGSFSKPTAFVKGAKWAITNLTDEEIKIWRENLE